MVNLTEAHNSEHVNKVHSIFQYFDNPYSIYYEKFSLVSVDLLLLKVSKGTSVQQAPVSLSQTDSGSHYGTKRAV